jgi:hypothetical protein
MVLFRYRLETFIEFKLFSLVIFERIFFLAKKIMINEHKLVEKSE